MTISEDAFLARLLPQLKMRDDVVIPPGDDCAGVKWGDDRIMLVAVDQLSADHHYYGRLAQNPTPPRLAGRKLIARNISDIAAMGGTPMFALVANAVEATCPDTWLEEFMAGVTDLADHFGVSIIGGDLGAAESAVASLTIIGEVDADHVMLRTRARPGDAIAVTGRLGGSLESGRHLTFDPRVEEGKWLAQYITCAIDLSDGLLKDLLRLCLASGCDATLDLERLPAHETAEAALMDGEDYELLVAIPAALVDTLVDQWPFAEPLTVIGQFGQLSGTVPQVFDTHNRTLSGPGLASGFAHFI